MVVALLLCAATPAAGMPNLPMADLGEVPGLPELEQLDCGLGKDRFLRRDQIVAVERARRWFLLARATRAMLHMACGTGKTSPPPPPALLGADRSQCLGSGHLALSRVYTVIGCAFLGRCIFPSSRGVGMRDFS